MLRWGYAMGRKRGERKEKGSERKRRGKEGENKRDR
jgi:hypothetical protein